MAVGTYGDRGTISNHFLADYLIVFQKQLEHIWPTSKACPLQDFWDSNYPEKRKHCFGGISHKGILAKATALLCSHTWPWNWPPFLGSSSEVNQSNEGKTMEVMTSLPFLSAVALSTVKERKKLKLEANTEFFHRNNKSICGDKSFKCHY